ncbi:hypothetical protein [Sphaerisporangium flaviroseum]|uniref:hypothetical protein n=1 Tax=Sphaerisporangium flaviroseum TaxID=509199 RepID=UPI0031ECC105
MRAGGDLLSDGWKPGQDPARAQSDDSLEFERPDLDRAGDAEGFDAAEDYERPEGYARPDDDQWDPDGEPEIEAESRRGFLGSGWTGEKDPDEERSSQNKRLVLAMVAIVVLAVAGGWIVSSSVGAKPEASCSTADCAPPSQDPTLTEGPTADPSTEPTDEPTGTPVETTSSPSETATSVPTASQAQVSDEPTTRPSPTRTRVRSPQPSPQSSSRPRQTEEPRIEDDPTERPSPSPTPPPTTQAPQPAPSPTQTKNGGLLDWLF